MGNKNTVLIRMFGDDLKMIRKATKHFDSDAERVRAVWKTSAYRFEHWLNSPVQSGVSAKKVRKSTKCLMDM